MPRPRTATVVAVVDPRDTIRFDGQVAVVVARTARSLDASGAAAREAGGDVLTVTADITSPVDAQRMADSRQLCRAGADLER